MNPCLVGSVAGMQRRFTLVHLTDLHSVDGLLHGVADSVGALERAADMIAESRLRVDAVVVSGDIADRGDETSYLRVRTTLRRIAERSGAALVLAPGNHDAPATLLEVFDEVDKQYPRITLVGGLRVVALDSTVPGHHHGDLDDGQLDRLRAVLDTPAADGTIVVLHHPPIASALPVFDRLGLRHPERLADVVRGSDVRLILAGHTHSATAGMLGGIPVWVGPACAYAQDSLPPAGRVRALAVHSFTRVDIVDDSMITTQVPIVTASTPIVYQMDADHAETQAVADAGLSATQIAAAGQASEPGSTG
jgi:Icc protein